MSAGAVDHVGVLGALHDKVSTAIDAQSIARDMFESNALTLKELQSIQCLHGEPVRAAEELLKIVMNQSDNVYSCFLDALKKTGHHDVFEAIVSDGCKGIFLIDNALSVAFVTLFMFIVCYAIL